VLLEDEVIEQTRWRDIRIMVKQHMKGLLPLGTLTTMPHPCMTAANKEAHDSMVQIDVAMDGQEVFPDAELAFYAECRAFAEFLMEKSGDRRIFGNIATHEAGGSNFQAWLKQNAVKFKLPGDIPALDRQFRDWLKARCEKP
jgi:hypothetical protein